MSTFAAIKDGVKQHQTAIAFVRTSRSQRNYDKCVASLQRKGLTVADKILASWVYGKDGEPVDFMLMPNEYPYDLPRGVKQYVLWYLTHASDSEIDGALRKRFAGCNITWFHSKKRTQSVPEIPHVHILLEKCTKNELKQ